MATEPWWGRRPPEGVTSAWGARAIYQRPDYVDIVWDRQSSHGEIESLILWLSGPGTVALHEALRQADLDVGSREVLSVISDGFTMEASPQGSHGYLYLGAWRSR